MVPPTQKITQRIWTNCVHGSHFLKWGCSKIPNNPVHGFAPEICPAIYHCFQWWVTSLCFTSCINRTQMVLVVLDEIPSRSLERRYINFLSEWMNERDSSQFYWESSVRKLCSCERLVGHSLTSTQFYLTTKTFLRIYQAPRSHDHASNNSAIAVLHVHIGSRWNKPPKIMKEKGLATDSKSG